MNGKKVGGNANICKFTAYVSPYFVVSNGGAYTKHIYAASQRIASKLGNVDGFGADPRRVEQAGGKKYDDKQSETIKARFEALNIDYSDGNGKKDDEEYEPTMDSEEPENLVFFYHPDHLGSTSYVTDADGNIAQHVEYIPYGEVFVEERNNSFSTNYLFNAKELDNETGLYYYGARYLDPTGAMWLSVDPMWEKYMGMSPYNYCMGNPVKLVDPLGMEVEDDVDDFINDDSHLLIGKFNHDCTDVEYRESCLTDEFSPIKDATSVEFVKYTGKIPVGPNYRNSDTGGCPAATLCSILDMFGVNTNDYDRSRMEKNRLDPTFGAKLNEYFDSFEGLSDFVGMNIIKKATAFSKMKKMKEEGMVYAMTYNESYYEQGEWKKGPHTVVVTGISFRGRRGKRGKVYYWDNRTGFERSLRTNDSNIENIFGFYHSQGANPWAPVSVNPATEYSKRYMFEK